MLGFPHHRIGALGAIGALIGLVAPSAAPAADPAEVASVVDHTDLRRQAAHYLGKGLVERARATVKAALLLPGALDDAKLQLLAAKVHLETGEIEQVFICLDRVDRSDDGDAKERAREVSERLQRDYGEVRVFPRGGGHHRARLHLVAAKPIIGLAKKRAFNRARTAAASLDRSYPASIYLPWGTFRANGMRFDHARGERTEVSVPFPRIAILGRPGDEGDIAAIDGLVGAIGGRTERFDLSPAGKLPAPILADLARSEPALIVIFGASLLGADARGLAEIPRVVGRVADWSALLGDAKAKDRTAVIHPSAPPGAVLDRLRRLVPTVRIVGLLHDGGPAAEEAEEASRAADDLGLRIRAAGATGVGDVGKALDDLGDEVDAYWILGGEKLATPGVFATVARRAFRERVPVAVPSLDLVRQGGLMSVEADPRDVGRIAADLAREALFAGEALGGRVVRADRVRWAINRATARFLGQRLPYQAVQEAWRVLSTAPSPAVLPE